MSQAKPGPATLPLPTIVTASVLSWIEKFAARGYGFLSESAYLAEVCAACHIKFIGPDPQVIRLMADKARARRVMRKAGVPILPGSDGPMSICTSSVTRNGARAMLVDGAVLPNRGLTWYE